MTAISTHAPIKPIFSNEAKFLTDLEEILPGDFKAKIYPSEEGTVKKAKVNTDDALDGIMLKRLITLAGKWNLPIYVGRSGAGLRIVFGKE